MLESVLVANRAEIASRVIATARRLGVRSVAVYSEADASLPYVRAADEAVLIGPPPPPRSYLAADAILTAAEQTGASAIHPGYGFLSESPAFAERVLAEGLIWVGPPPAAMAQMSDKIRARNLMAAAGVPVAAGTAEPVTGVQMAMAEAARIGYPVMVKAAAGGGGIGMSAADGPEALAAAFETARTRAERFFGSPAILLERFVPRARHIEVQIFGLADGTVVALGERDCSVQRRHQKVAEETPSPGVGQDLRERLLAAAVRAGEAVGYRGAGTVEFLLDVSTLPPMGMPSNCASMPRIRCGSCPARARSPSGSSPPGRACGWMPGTRRATWSRRSTIRCWPSCACTARAGQRRWPGRRPRWPGSGSPARRPICRSTPTCWPARRS